MAIPDKNIWPSKAHTPPQQQQKLLGRSRVPSVDTPIHKYTYVIEPCATERRWSSSGRLSRKSRRQTTHSHTFSITDRPRDHQTIYAISWWSRTALVLWHDGRIQRRFLLMPTHNGHDIWHGVESESADVVRRTPKPRPYTTKCTSSSIVVIDIVIATHHTLNHMHDNV